MTIRNNIFDNCMFGNWGRAIISLDAGEEPEPADVPRFNRNVLVENNEFRLVDSRIVSAVMERSVHVDIEKE